MPSPPDGPPPVESSPPAVRAFDAVARSFDSRFGSWESVAAQRRAVRRELLAVFPEGSSLLELGGGTGEDALFLAERGRRVTLTDGSPEMVARAREKVRAARLEGKVSTAQVALEDLSRFVEDHLRAGRAPFDGCFSNFASLNCVEHHGALAQSLARVLSPGAHVLLVLFGPFSPGEILVLSARGNLHGALRRFRRGPVPARISGHDFTVWYPRPSDLARSFSPGFVLSRTRGIGIAVPPSSAEPWVSRLPRLVHFLERLDRHLTAPLALLGDHVLLDFVRTRNPAGEVR